MHISYFEWSLVKPEEIQDFDDHEFVSRDFRLVIKSKYQFLYAFEIYITSILVWDNSNQFESVDPICGKV